MVRRFEQKNITATNIIIAITILIYLIQESIPQGGLLLGLNNMALVFKTRQYGLLTGAVGLTVAGYAANKLRKKLSSEAILVRKTKEGKPLPPKKVKAEQAQLEKRILTQNGEVVQVKGPMDGLKARKLLDQEKQFYKRTKESLTSRMGKLFKRP
jgi:hypothetical protein